MNIDDFKTQVLPVKNKLYRIALRYLTNQEDAEDAVQETMLRLWKRKEKLKDLKSIEAFAVTITKNLCLDKLRSKKFEGGEVEDYMLKTERDPHSRAEVSDAVQHVKQIIETLPEQQKVIIQLRDIEGYSNEEAAQMLEMNVVTLRVNLSRARKRVREELMNRYNYEA
jgi:RNA polymerase sigma-70 factor (ECF subfamily)